MKSRSEVVAQDKWNVEDMFSGPEEWKKDFMAVAKHGEVVRWPELQAFKGRLGEGAVVYKEALEAFLGVSRHLETLYTYAHLRHDEETILDENKVNYDKIVTLYHDLSHEAAWFEPETLLLDQSILEKYLSAEELKEYSFYLEKVVRKKKHTLPAEQEELLALSAKSIQTAQKSFQAMNNADFKFSSVLNEKGEEKELTHASYGLYLREHDRVLRKNAFLSLHGKFSEFENTLCEMLSGQVNGHLFQARARKYSSCLDAALFPKNVDLTVYHSLIKAVRSKIGALHRYTSVRKRLMGVDELHLYDMYVPLVSEIDMKMTYEEAESVIVESVAPLGNEYQEALRKGLKDDRWVDRYENQNKRSGAYSSGCYDSMPYILMNYQGTLNDVFTLAHEAGHSMHSLLSRKHQPYHYSDYPIFVAEVASTFNEELLMQLMLKKAKSKEEKIYLINQKIEDIRATLFRQTMFAEFELWIHENAEKGIPLTPTSLKEEYRKLNEAYFGPDVVIDDEIEIEWSRIPHFYYNFYVYQYATGISAALALTDKVLNGGEKDREDYLGFLKGGYSRYPLDLLRGAGIDMASPEPVNAAIGKFESLVGELEKLTGLVAEAH
ncbi:MAG: oligoendopeptidase F [Chlamydiales bacterium]